MAFSTAVYNGYGINKRERKMRERYRRKEYDRIENLTNKKDIKQQEEMIKIKKDDIYE